MKLFNLSHLVAEGDHALVTSFSGKKSTVIGPARVSSLSSVELYERQILREGDCGYLIAEDGHQVEVEGPSLIHIHPEGEYLPHTRYDLAGHEALVVIDEKGEYKVHLGKDDPTVWVKYGQRVHTFYWTGSKGDTEEKQPRALRLDVLRIQDTQTYVAFPVRTKDNIVVTLRLMVYYGYTNVQLLIENDDPLGAMYNKIMSAMVEYVATLPFEDFKEETNTKIASHPLFTKEGEEGKGFFEKFGIKVHQVVVRAWEPHDAGVQKILERSATIQTERSIDQAQHERKMKQLEYEGHELDEAAKLDEKRMVAAKAEGEREAASVSSMVEGLVPTLGKETVRELVLIRQATSKAETVHISPEMFGK